MWEGRRAAHPTAPKRCCLRAAGTGPSACRRPRCGAHPRVGAGVTPNGAEVGSVGPEVVVSGANDVLTPPCHAEELAAALKLRAAQLVLDERRASK